MEFYKYHGTGNDFVMIDNRKKTFELSQEEIASVCHRRFGIGADGLILLENHPNADFLIHYYNADGNKGSLCGNGSRCAVQFAADLEIINDKANFIAIDGEHQAEIKEGLVYLSMKNVKSIIKERDGFFADTGSPHLIIFNENVDSLDVASEGARIRYSEYWQKTGGVNVNFVEKINTNTLKVRTYERGVEAETYSCGTGAVAAAIIANAEKAVLSPVEIIFKGGKLEVSFVKNAIYSQIILSGRAQKVFSGTF